ncbi:MAG: hypothetical protein IJK59_03520 [Firmicutes bacterium]|nr:hypothetical protein [Bacillota bacterium]MBQ6013199.1 hypothetical protein [Bacillota bacterium]MBQ6260299.1 hypothetical protein [Bacillota bacterium]MBR0114851.1 hypothetical protein [Bacillota bacterium]MBR0441111.1 hypothetical protein [Bacillota bacterium]
MNDIDIDELIRKEKQKIIRELRKAKISKHKMKVLESVIDNVAFLKVKLDEVRAQLLTEELMVEYDNGGGQKGIRENPIYKQYQSLFGNFMKGMDKILQPMPDTDEAQQALVQEIKPETVLDRIRQKREERS